MRVKNIPAKTSIKSIITMAMLSIIYTAFIIWAYTGSAIGTEKSISGFFSWAAISFNELLQNNPEDPWTAWVTFIILPAAFYLGLIGSIVSRQFALKEMNSTLNLKSVDFLPDRVKFNFNRAQYDFVCGYGDIKSMEMILKTIVVRDKYGSRVLLKEIQINFSVLKDKFFTLYSAASAPMGLIYKLLDYSRMINNFSYSFSPHEQEDIKEKIENYLQKGVKPLLTKNVELNCKWLSIVFFLIGLVPIFPLKNVAPNEYRPDILMFVIMAVLFIGNSLLLDLILIIDKIKEKGFRGYNG